MLRSTSFSSSNITLQPVLINVSTEWINTSEDVCTQDRGQSNDSQLFIYNRTHVQDCNLLSLMWNLLNSKEKNTNTANHFFLNVAMRDHITVEHLCLLQDKTPYM